MTLIRRLIKLGFPIKQRMNNHNSNNSNNIYCGTIPSMRGLDCEVDTHQIRRMKTETDLFNLSKIKCLLS